MWEIEVSEDASEEEIEEALLEAIDFDHVRECVAELREAIESYGPFVEVQDENETSQSDEIVKTYDEKRGWICDDLEKVDSRKVWTYFQDPVNNYSYLVSGYKFVGKNEKPSIHEIQSWFISEKIVEDSDLILTTEFIISHFFTDSDDDGDYYFRLDLWDLVEAEDLSDEEIIGVLSS